MAPGDANVAVLFASTNNPNPNNTGAFKPVLTINAIPEPASAMLILTAIGFVPLRRRR